MNRKERELDGDGVGDAFGLEVDIRVSNTARMGQVFFLDNSVDLSESGLEVVAEFDSFGVTNERRVGGSEILFGLG